MVVVETVLDDDELAPRVVVTLDLPPASEETVVVVETVLGDDGLISKVVVT